VAVATSGSTGRPKWVALSRAALAASAQASASRLGGAGRWLLALPTAHIAGLNVVVRAVLAGGEPEALPPGPFTPAAFLRAAARLGPGPKFTALVPTQLRRLVRAAESGPGALAGLAQA
jgi:O-succinylbenzoic acid--CoA ligase